MRAYLKLKLVSKRTSGGSSPPPLIFIPNWGPKGRIKPFLRLPPPPPLSQGIEARLRITANVTTDEGIRMGSKSFAKLSTNCWCWGIFFAIAWVRMILGRELFINNFQVVNNILRFSFQSQIILLNSSETLHFHTRGNIWNKRHCHHFFLAPVTVQNMGNAKTLDKPLASAV